MNTYQAQGLSGEFEFEADTQEFEDTEFGEAEFEDAEFEDAEFEDEWTGEVRDHRRRPGQVAAPRVRDHRRPAPYRSNVVSPGWSQRSRSYSPRSSWWGGARPRYGYRPSGAQQQYRWGRPALTSQWYRGSQYPGRYWRFGQGQNYPGATPNWGGWGRWRRRYPYGYGGSAYAQRYYYDEPSEPPYEEPPMPPPVIVAPPPPPPQVMVPPPPEAPQTPPQAMTPPPAQDQAQSGEFFIEPEAFEYEAGLNEYETGWGEMESGYGESEGADGPPQLLGTYEPKPLTGPCPTYLPGEEARSKTDAGHLPTDVFVGPDRLLIADFGVDWRHVKPVAARDPKLKAWLTSMIARMRSDPTVGLSIFGFSDCVGTVSHNMFLRQGRAERTRQLLLTLAAPADRAFLDSRIFSATAADPGHFLADNGTVAGRAKNRAAIILATPIIRIHDTPPGPQGPTLYARRR